nr:ATP-dependent DNA helicase RecG [Nanchangia anserum]
MERVCGARAATALAKLGLVSVKDLLFHFPRRYETFAELTPMTDLSEGEEASLVAEVVDQRVSQSHRNRRLWILTVTLTDGVTEVSATFFARSSGMLRGHQERLSVGTRVLCSGKIARYRDRWQLSHPAYQVLEDRGEVGTAEQARELAATPTPIYPRGQGVATWTIEAALRPILDTLSPADIDETIPDDIRARDGMPGIIEALNAIHRPARIGDDRPARRRFAYEEALVLQVALARARLAAEAIPATRCPPREGGIHDAILAALPFDLTDAQVRAGRELDRRLDSERAMNVLLQGDVGAGKTLVALLAIARALDAGAQAALLAPTEVLAYQHFRTITHMLGPLATSASGGVAIELLTGSSRTPHRRQVLATLASGTPALVVGTHALLSDNVQLPGLALAVIDEQHRFGVNQRDRLRSDTPAHPHMLVMTATPIPRTVAMTVFGDLDTVVLDQVPARRVGVDTFLVSTARRAWVERAWQRAREEIAAGGRVFVVCPRIDEAEGEKARASVESVARTLRATPALAGVAIGELHGRMNSADKDRIMGDFAAGRLDLIVSTTVIEVGVDVPEATMMIVCDAESFGLSQLHQLRGRIGRGSKAGVCLALTSAAPNTTAMRRLEAFASTTDGFLLAQEDLELRSEGDILGDTQSGRRSGLRLLSVRRDADLISRARDDARALLEADPTLESVPGLVAALDDVDPSKRAYLERS